MIRGNSVSHFNVSEFKTAGTHKSAKPHAGKTQHGLRTHRQYCIWSEERPTQTSWPRPL